MVDFLITAEIAKRDDEQRIVWGWASVVTEDGQPVVDLQGDVVDIDEIQKAVHAFIADSRTGGDQHRRFGIGEVVDSIVLTKAVQDALGIDLGREGWFVGMRVDDEKVWKGVKSGHYGGFSIGGSGVRIEMEG